MFSCHFFLPIFKNSDGSVSIKVGVHIARTQMLPTISKLSWETYNEDTNSLGGGSSRMTVAGLLEQINVTRDTSDYLWYMTR